MAIDFTQERWTKIKDDARQWWAGELERPLIQVTLGGRNPSREEVQFSGREAGRGEPDLPYHHFTPYYGLDIPAEAIVDRHLYNLECTKFLGDGFPCTGPNFGPGSAAAFMGAELHNAEDGRTVWFHPKEKKEAEDLHFAHCATDERWWNRLLDLYRAFRDRSEGLVQISTTDLGGNLDILSSFRPGEELLLDLYDCPEEVKRLTWEAHEMWWHYFEEINNLLKPTNPGYTAWCPIFSEEPYYMLQCDFCYMIGPDMFDEFVKPELEASCKRLTNPFYHLDGVGQLPHLDSLLEIEELKGVQWVPGDGQPGIAEWPDVYRKIRDAGKLIQFWSGQDPSGLDALSRIADQLGSAKGICCMSGGPIEKEDEFCRWLESFGAL